MPERRQVWEFRIWSPPLYAHVRHYPGAALWEICGKWASQNAELGCKRLFLLASPRGFEPLLPP